MHQSLSLRTTLGAAFSAISHPHFTVRHSTLQSPPSCDDPSLNTFHTHLAQKLQQLKSSHMAFDGGYLNLQWLQEALALILATNSQVEAFVCDVQLQSCGREERWVEEYLDDSGKLLDVCNVLKEGIATIREYELQVEMALRLLDIGKLDRSLQSVGKCLRVKASLQECLTVMKRKDEEVIQGKQRPTLESCSSTLRRMGERQLSPATPADPKGKAFVSAIYGAKLSTIFVAGVIAAALMLKPRRALTSLHVPSHFPWAAALLSLQQKIKEEVARKGGSFGAQLVEVGRVDAGLRQLHGFVESIHDAMEGGYDLKEVGDGDDDEDVDEVMVMAKRVREEVRKECAGMKDGLRRVEQQVNELFRMLVKSRVALLDLLSHSPHARNS